jgi:CRP-like cAMP-binding protein
MALAGCLALLALLTAAFYEWRSTPFTMVAFLMGGSALLLLAIALFSWAIWRDLRSRLDSVVTKEFAAGDNIYRQGDPAEHIFVITRGQVELLHADPTQGQVLLGRLSANDFFGETAILNRLPRQATARAVEALEVLAIHRTDFLRLYASLPRLRARIDRQQARRRALIGH